jgi:hypothetical protein
MLILMGMSRTDVDVKSGCPRKSLSAIMVITPKFFSFRVNLFMVLKMLLALELLAAVRILACECFCFGLLLPL